MRIFLIVAIAALFLLPSNGLTAESTAAPPSQAALNKGNAPLASTELQNNTADSDPEYIRLLREKQELEKLAHLLDHQIRKEEAHLAQHHREVQKRAQRRDKARVIQQHLEPYLDEIALQLAQTVQDDLPFLKEEREQRLAGLHATLNDYDVPLEDKLRRTLETLLIEARYGMEVTVEEAIIQTHDGAVQGRSLRVGRLAAFFLSRDKGRVWALDRKRNEPQWTEAEEDTVTTVCQAIEMVEKRTPARLAILPVQLHWEAVATYVEQGSVQP